MYVIDPTGIGHYFDPLQDKKKKINKPCAGYVRHVTHDEIADAVG